MYRETENIGNKRPNQSGTKEQNKLVEKKASEFLLVPLSPHLSLVSPWSETLFSVLFCLLLSLFLQLYHLSKHFLQNLKGIVFLVFTMLFPVSHPAAFLSSLHWRSFVS